MKKAKNVKCSKCGYVLNLDKVKLLETICTVPGGEKESKEYKCIYFVCPKCKKKYLISIYDDECLQIIKQMDEQVQMLQRTKQNKIYSDEERNKRIVWLENNLKDKRQSLSNQMQKLKDEYLVEFQTLIEQEPVKNGGN